MSHAIDNPVKIKIRRAWLDLAPKLLAFLTGGTAASAIVYALDNYFGVSLEPGLAALIVTVAATVLGYFVKDTATVSPGQVLAVSEIRVQKLVDTPPAFRGEDV